jgi:hypothetical protein
LPFLYSVAMSQVEKNTGEALELEQARSALTHNDEKMEKPVSTVYIPDHAGSHNKSKEERRLVLKIDCLIVSLSALLYFVAYLVSAAAWYCQPWL